MFNDDEATEQRFSKPADAVDPAEKEDVLDKRNMRVMKLILFGVITIWCVISVVTFFVSLWSSDSYIWKLIENSPYYLLVAVILVAVPAIMLSYLACCVFRPRSNVNENNIVSLFERLVRVWRS